MSKQAKVVLSRFPSYEIHRDGLVVSLVHKKPRVMKPIRAGEYRGLTLLDASCKQRRVYVHHLVCEAFHGPRPDGCVCRHLDGNRLNNCAENLAWGTPSENNKDKNLHGTSPHGERNPGAKLTNHAVKEMRRIRSIEGRSYAKIAAAFGVSAMTAHRAINGKSWSLQ